MYYVLKVFSCFLFNCNEKFIFKQIVFCITVHSLIDKRTYTDKQARVLTSEIGKSLKVDCKFPMLCKVIYVLT